MNGLEQHEIAEAEQRILNPFSEEKLLLLGRLCQIGAGHRLLDLACGKGELLCRWAAEFGAGGLGIDISEVFLLAARARAFELDVTHRVTFQQGDASQAVPDLPEYDVVSCLGAPWLGDGLVGTIGLMRPALRPGGLLLVGQEFWAEPPGPEALAGTGLAPDDLTCLAGLLDQFAKAGTELVEMVLADVECWDRYLARQWWAVSRWLESHRGDPRAPQMREYLDSSRGSYLAFDRRYRGWGVFVLRTR